MLVVDDVELELLVLELVLELVEVELVVAKAVSSFLQVAEVPLVSVWT